MHLQLLEFLSLWSELHRGVLQLQYLEMSQLPPPFACDPTGHRSVRQIHCYEFAEHCKRVEIPRHFGAAKEKMAQTIKGLHKEGKSNSFTHEVLQAASHCGAAEVQVPERQIRQGAEVPMDPGAVERQKSEMWRLLESLDVPRQVRRGQLYLSASQRQFLVDVDKYV